MPTGFESQLEICRRGKGFTIIGPIEFIPFVTTGFLSFIAPSFARKSIKEGEARLSIGLQRAGKIEPIAIRAKIDPFRQNKEIERVLEARQRPGIYSSANAFRARSAIT
nr:hypothetical protein [Sphingobium fluviale]